ncbi:septation protein SepH [Blastococcus sp. CCUG 61487]|uniref:septation protein SepH n=1 Tax=Blastococcus sp. CCUG 61487 TaxID=1840703 RepID=UPI0010C0BDA2|nr:septation protein SepH [Blastococcus sp. CCUG 61487]TKJ16622.1 DNA-binding protein [Blastococcus sp. CCUG 61487]
MRTLRLVGLSDDGSGLLLVADTEDGEEKFLLPVDDRVRAAARGDSRRLTQIDVDLGTELPPRVIQQRIRAGETPEQVAAATGARVERIMRFAHPVLQERERVAEQAGEARVRLTDSTTGSTLQQFMTERLRLVDAPVQPVAWDAHRSDTGTWVVTGEWRAGETSGTTRWTFDLPSRTVAPLDATTADFAEGTRLVRVVPDVPTGPPPVARPVAAVPEEPRPASVVVPPADDDELVRDVHPASGSLDDRSADSILDEIADHDTVVLGRSGEESDSDDPRARIPAWEDIVFGVRRTR